LNPEPEPESLNSLDILYLHPGFDLAVLDTTFTTSNWGVLGKPVVLADSTETPRSTLEVYDNRGESIVGLFDLFFGGHLHTLFMSSFLLT